jgi:bacterioferritin-associated ferredoxin
MIICLCREVSERQVETAVAKGAATAHEVSRACDWIEAQLELIRQVGAAQYLAQQIRESET